MKRFQIITLHRFRSYRYIIRIMLHGTAVMLTGERLEQQMAFWKTQLGNNLPLLQLVTDHPRPAVKSTRGASVHNEIGQQLTADLRKFCKQEGVTLYITLITVLYILLYRYSESGRFRHRFADLRT